MERSGADDHGARRSDEIPASRVLVDDDVRHADAIVYGWPGAREIAIGRGMLLLHAKAPAHFKARIAHELAHIKNADLDTAFYARGLVFSAMLVLTSLIGLWLIQEVDSVLAGWSAWRATSGSGAPYSEFYLFALARFAERFWSLLTRVVPGAVVWFLLLWFEYRAFVRARELLADAEAARWVDGRALSETLLAGKSAKQQRKFIDRLKFLVSAHPTRAERLQSLRHPNV
jgi:Zn-dependent protease with chaperone function